MATLNEVKFQLYYHMCLCYKSWPEKAPEYKVLLSHRPSHFIRQRPILVHLDLFFLAYFPGVEKTLEPQTKGKLQVLV